MKNIITGILIIIVSVGALVFYLNPISISPDDISFSGNNNLKYKTYSSWKEVDKALQYYKEEQDYRIDYYGVTGTMQSAINSEGLKATSNFPTIANNDKSYRYSETNVQVKGIDEADIVKTNGNTIAFSPGYDKTYIINALPIDKINITKILKEGGNLYLKDNKVYVINYKEIIIYDIDSGKELWNIKFNGTYVGSRMYEDNIYVVTRKYSYNPIIYFNGYEISPLKYHLPVIPDYYDFDADYQYVVAKIDIGEGKIKDALEFSGSYDLKIYMTKDVIYGVSRLSISEEYFMLEFMKDILPKYLPQDLSSKVKRIINNKDFSPESKYLELEMILRKYSNSLNREQKEDLENKIEKDYDEYFSRNFEKYEKSLIIRISIDDFSFKSGEVPGHILNQFSMDEYNGYFRVATTIGNWRIRDRTTNNIYILNKDLDIVGKLTGLEKGERIYAVRFEGDKAYMVTYRETDPLFVIDLSNPKNPKVLGELKIPGYSTYLHNIGDGLYVGIGKNDRNRVKVSLFDVSNFSNPKELDSYSTTSYWSKALYEHHAFLWDSDNNVLSLPMGQELYIFKINKKKGKIKLLKIVEFKGSVLRSLYINDYLYGFSRAEMKVINEDIGDVLKTLKFPYTPIYHIYESSKSKNVGFISIESIYKNKTNNLTNIILRNSGTKSYSINTLSKSIKVLIDNRSVNTAYMGLFNAKNNTYFNTRDSLIITLNKSFENINDNQNHIFSVIFPDGVKSLKYWNGV